MEKKYKTLKGAWSLIFFYSINILILFVIDVIAFFLPYILFAYYVLTFL